MNKQNLSNLLAPLSVSIIVITLGAAFGALSGRGAFIGMVSACVITLITALLSGSKYGVSSPTGPMTATIGSIMLLDQQWLQSHTGELDLPSLVNLTLFTAGILLFLFNLFKIHKLIKWIPNLVISGFLNGIALLIVYAQFNSMKSQADWILILITFSATLLIGNLNKNFSHLSLRMLSSSLLIIVLASLFSWIFQASVSYVNVESTSLSLNLAWPALNLIGPETYKIIFLLALELSLIALLDTLLTAVIMEKKSKKKSNMSRELSGQSLSLLGVSLIGGIPGAQSTVPSMMLFQEKGNHRKSKLLLALFCIIFTFVLSGFIQFVPMAVFGGIIIKIAFDVADWKSIKTIIKSEQTLTRSLLLIGTTILTVFVSLNLAVILFTLTFILWNKYSPPKWKIKDLKEDESEGIEDEI